MYLGRVRKNGRVFRVYLTPKDYLVKELEYACGELKKYSDMRSRVRREFMDKAAKLGETSLENAKKILFNIIRRYSLEEDDLEIYIDDAVRSGKLKIIDY